jgi:hypothetical protein
MTTHRWPRIALVAMALGLIGCDIPTGPNTTGTPVRPAQTNGPNDPGSVKAGGPGAQGQEPK